MQGSAEQRAADCAGDEDDILFAPQELSRCTLQLRGDPASSRYQLSSIILNSNVGHDDLTWFGCRTPHDPVQLGASSSVPLWPHAVHTKCGSMSDILTSSDQRSALIRGGRGAFPPVHASSDRLPLTDHPHHGPTPRTFERLDLVSFRRPFPVNDSPLNSAHYTRLKLGHFHSSGSFLEDTRTNTAQCHTMFDGPGPNRSPACLRRTGDRAGHRSVCSYELIPLSMGIGLGLLQRLRARELVRPDASSGEGHRNRKTVTACRRRTGLRSCRNSVRLRT
jgi:hypothetical protein